MAASRANRLRLCWRPTQQRLTDRLQRYEQLDYTYVEVGATCAASLPAGYHHIDHSTIAGTGHKTFALLAKALWGWQLQRCAGLVVATSHDTVTIGVTVLNAIPGRPGLVAPCRVVESSMTTGGVASPTGRCPVTRCGARNGSRWSPTRPEGSYCTSCRSACQQDLPGSLRRWRAWASGPSTVGMPRQPAASSRPPVDPCPRPRPTIG